MSIIQLTVGNVVTQVHDAPREAHELLYTALAYRPNGYIWMPSYKSGQWDGWKRLYRPPNRSVAYGKFPSGLLFRARSALESIGAPYECRDTRQAPKTAPRALSGALEARPYLVAEALLARTRGVVKAPTGSGKTALAAMIFGKIGLPGIFVVHRLSLLSQARAEFERFLEEPAGIIQGENRELRRVNVAMIQSLDRLLWSAMSEHPVARFVHDECQVLIADEIHHARAPIYGRVFNHFMAAYYRFALSATPLRGTGEDMEIEAHFGRMISDTEKTALVQAKYLSKVHVFYV